MKKLIIGICGENGAGKDTVAAYLETKGFAIHSLSDELRALCREEGNTKLTREILGAKAAALDKEEKGQIARLALERTLKKPEEYIALSSIRRPSEVKKLQEYGRFFLIAVRAAAEERYKRITAREREGENTISFKEFIEQEQNEENSNDPNGRQIDKTIALAKYTLNNNGSIEELQQDIESAIERALEEINK